MRRRDIMSTYCTASSSDGFDSLTNRISECISKGEAIDFVFEDEELQIDLQGIAAERTIAYETAKGKIRDLKKLLKERTISFLEEGKVVLIYERFNVSGDKQDYILNLEYSRVA